MKLFHLLTAAILIAFCFCSCAAYNNHITGTFIGDNGQRYVKVSPSWKQAYKSATKTDKTLFWLGSGGAAISIPWAATLYNPTSMFPITLTCAAVAGGSMEWYKWNCDKALPKTQYDSLKAAGVKDIYSTLK